MIVMYPANFAFIDGLKYCKRVYNSSANRRCFEIRIFNRDYIKDLRKLLGWSQDTMAVAFGINTHSLSQFECNPNSNIKSIPFNPLLMNEYMGRAIAYMRDPIDFCDKHNCSTTKAEKFYNTRYVKELDKGKSGQGMLIADSDVEFATINSKLPFKIEDTYFVGEGKDKVRYFPVNLLGLTVNYLNRIWDWSKDTGFSMKTYGLAEVSNKSACEKYSRLIKSASTQDIDESNKELDNILVEVKNVNKNLVTINNLLVEFFQYIRNKDYH